MAQKITIDGQDLLQTLQDDWGGVNDGNSPITPYSDRGAENVVPAGAEWGVNRGEVESFIKRKLGEADVKAGGFAISNDIDANNYYHLLGFKTSAQATAYKQSGETEGLLFDVEIPISTVQADTYRATLSIDKAASSNGSPYLFKYGNAWSVGVRLNAWHLIAADNSRELVNATTRLIVERSSDGSNWYPLLTTQITTTGSESAFPASVDLGSALNFGSDNEIRIRFSIAAFSYEDNNGETKLLSAQPIVMYVKPVSLSVLMPDAQWQQAKVLDSTYVNLRFVLSGNVEKTLHYTIDNHSETITGITDVGNKDVTAYDNNNEGFLTSGVHYVDAWLTCTSVDGSTLESDHIHHQIMVINNADTSGAMVKRVLIQGMAESVDNFVQSEVCRYMIWNPKLVNGNIENDTETYVLVRFVIASSSNLSASHTEYLSLPVSQRGGYASSLMATLEVEGTAGDVGYNAYLHALDSENNAMLSPEFLRITNEGGFQPVLGSVFHLNPKTRNNGEVNPKTIINARNPSNSPQSTWDGFNMDNSDGYTTDSTGEKVLRIPAGRKLTIAYNPFAYFYNSPSSSKSMTMDIDMCVRNIVNEQDPIFKLAEQSGSAWLGLLMRPLDGTMVSVQSSTIVEETDFRWAEDRRVHVSINIVPNIKPYDGTLLYNSSQGGDPNATLALVRVFINGVIVREIRYNKENASEFCTGAMSNGGIVIGQEGTGGRHSGADIDIYGIRIWEEELTAKQVLQNYISTIPDGATKRRIKHNNEITDSQGKVKLKLVKDLGKNTMVWHGENGRMPLIGDDSKKGWIEINRYDNDGNYLPQYSGTFCKETKKLKAKGQGTTAMSYYYWNLQVKLGDVGWDDNGDLDMSQCITLVPSMIHSDIHLGTPVESGGSYVVPVYGGCLGKNYPLENTTKNYPCVVDGNGDIVSVTLPDGWVDGNGLYRGQCWQSGPNIPFAQKLVLKINYASSMQSHLIGANWLFNDLHTLICGKNKMQRDAEAAGTTALVAKHVEPVLFFVTDSSYTDEQVTESQAVFQGAGGMGAGKMDKPTWGYVKSLHPKFAMFEGSVNNSLLTDMLVPFDDVDHTIIVNGAEQTQPAKVKYWLHDPTNQGGKDPECFFYRMTNESNEDVWEKGIGFDGGKTGRTMKENPSTDADMLNNLMCSSSSCDVPEEAPSVAITNIFRAAWNFLYMHNPNINLYEGSFTDFVNTYSVNFSNEDRRRKWVCVSAGGSDVANDYKVKRYDFCERRWVDAGLWNDTNHAYDAVDIRTGVDMAQSSMREPHNVLAKHLELLMADAKANIGNYFKVTSLKFHYAFVNMLIAGSDNCSKNTYYVIDPETELIELHQDDVDTILATDNFGYQTKPYYIDRKHPYPEGNDKSGYDGMQNGLFDLVEAMWLEDASHTISGMMAQIINSIVGLTGGLSSAESDAMDNSVWRTLNKYLFDIQRWIPQAAYNDTARVRYEFPAAMNYEGREGLARPLPQSMGDQLEAEIQFMKRRLIYMASFAGCCEFTWTIGSGAVSLGIADMGRRFPLTIKNLPNNVAPPSLVFKVIPHQYIYPCCYQDQTSYNSYTRVAAGEEFVYTIQNPAVKNDYALTLPAINYYRSIGNIGDASSSTLTLVGKRLTTFVAEPTKYYENVNNGVIINAAAYEALQDKTGYFPAFMPANIVVPNADLPTRLLNFSMKGVPTVESSIAIPFDMSMMTGVQRIDLRGTKMGRVLLPKTLTLTELYLPASIASLDIDGQSNLATLEFEGVGSLQTLRLIDVPSTIKVGSEIKSVNSLLVALLSVEPLVLQSLTLRNLNATMPWVAFERFMAINNIDVSGTIAINTDVTYEQAKRIMQFNAAHPNLSVTINPVSINGIIIGTRDTNWNWGYCPNSGIYNFIVEPTNNGNNLKSVEWEIIHGESTVNAEISNDGVLTVNRNELDNGATEPITVKCTMTLLDDTEFTAEQVINFIEHEAERGDFVFADGTFSNYDCKNKTVVGICFYVGSYTENGETKQDRRMITCVNFVLTGYSNYWGLSSNSSAGVPNLTYSEDPSYSVYDVPYVDSTSGARTTWVGVGIEDIVAGKILPRGRHNTLKIIQHRNKLLQGIGLASLVGNSPIPTAHDGISEINDVVLKSIALRDAAVNAGLANGANYHLLYYRCASLAYAYIPNVQDWEQEHLAFPIHSWWLPDTFEMATIASAIQDTSSTPKEKPDHIFKAAINAGRFTMFPKSTGYDGGQFASSSEYNATTIIATRFFLNNSYTNGQAASGYGIPYKHLSFLMRFANNF